MDTRSGLHELTRTVSRVNGRKWDPSRKARLGVLDGLRGLAVLLVLWYHVWEFSWLNPLPSLAFLPATGFAGVMLFFFLSGFVISYPFVRSRAAGMLLPSWAHFAWRRFMKIVPSYALSIGVAYAIGYAVVQPYASPLPDLVTYFLFVHTWFTECFGMINGRSGRLRSRSTCSASSPWSGGVWHGVPTSWLAG